MVDRSRSPDWLAHAAHASTDAVVGVDPAGLICYANQAATRLTGHEEGSLLGRPCRDVFRFIRPRPDSSDDALTTVLSGRAVAVLPAGTVVIDAGGTEHLVVGTCSPVATGADVGAVLIVRRLADDPAFTALRTSQDRLKEVQRIGRIGTWEIDLGGGRHHWSDEIYRIFEVRREELGNSVRAFMGMVHADDRPAVESAFQRAVAECGTYDVTHRVVTRVGTKVVHSRGEVASDPGGRAVRAVGTIQDVSELQEAMERTRFQAALTESVADAVIGTDTDFVIRVWNPAAETIYGIPAAEAVGRRMPELVPIEYPSGSGDEALATLQRSGRWEGDVRMRRRDGTWREILASVSQVTGSGDRPLGYVAVNRDVTELRNLERARAESERLENLGRLAASVAHDFNNALQAIVGHADLARAAVGPSAAGDDLAQIHRLASASAELARHLQAMAGEQIAQPQVLDLSEAVAAARSAVLETAGADLEVVWRMGSGLGPVRIDPRQVERLLLQLVRNAREALGGRGRVTLSTAARGADTVTLAVRDDGPGMDEPTIRRAFEPLFTTKQQSGTTGLGLAIVAGIVRQNGGTIEIESTLGEGTTVMIHLPVWVEAAPAPAPPAAPGRAGIPTVVLVEDEDPVRRVTDRGLARGGFQVISFGNPVEALAYLERAANPADLLITDVMMPGLTGKELADRVAAVRPALPCLFVSGYPADVIATHGVVDDAVELLQKPFTLDELQSRVRHLLARTT